MLRLLHRELTAKAGSKGSEVWENHIHSQRLTSGPAPLSVAPHPGRGGGTGVRWDWDRSMLGLQQGGVLPPIL